MAWALGCLAAMVCLPADAATPEAAPLPTAHERPDAAEAGAEPGGVSSPAADVPEPRAMSDHRTGARGSRSGGSAENPLNAIAPPIPASTPSDRATREAPRSWTDLPPPGAPSRGTGTAPSPSETPAGPAAVAVAYARAQVGLPYRLGGVGPATFDCSGLVFSAYAAAGVPLPRTSQEQSGLRPVTGALLPGDVLYWGAPGAATHVAVYVGGGRFVGAQNTRTGVVERPVEGSGYTGAVRVA
ncbi:NlpC/P60 family protein [Streptomyces sp. NPDC057101]|uniref:C40 family peptidase n=1 Tax=Streptomyces sp. NPDC057101 TaxID=3346020 RepID=UPI00362E18BD